MNGHGFNIVISRFNTVAAVVQGAEDGKTRLDGSCPAPAQKKPTPQNFLASVNEEGPVKKRTDGGFEESDFLGAAKGKAGEDQDVH